MKRRAAPLALLAVVLSACSPSIEDSGTSPSIEDSETVEVPTSEGSSAQLRVIDSSGFLVSASGVPDAGATDDFELQPVRNASNTIRVAWIASPCEDRPHLTVGGRSLEALELVLDRGPVPEDAVCPGMGLVHGVDLVFSGDVSVDDVDAEMSGQ